MLCDLEKAIMEFKYIKVVCWYVLHLLLTIAGTQGALLLTSDKQYVQLHWDITLTCNTSDNIDSIEFRRDTNYVGRCTIFVCESSHPTKFIVNNSNMSGYNIFTLTVKDFEVKNEGFYKCFDMESMDASGIQIRKAVNITSVTLTPKTDPISVIENVPQLFRCVTSTCRPVATVMWYLGSTQLTSGSESSTSNDVTTSTLDYIPQKSHQGMRILCRGSNGGKVQTSDDQPKLIVLFPPVVKPLTKVLVLERDNVSVACQITAGVPNTTDFTWERMSDMIPISMEQTLVILSIDRKQDGNYRCTASNLMEPTVGDATVGNSSNTVYIDVQFAPTAPTFHFGGRAGANIPDNYLSVIRGNVTTVTCESIANPMPDYTWNGNNTAWTFTPTDDENRTCTVRNSMVTTENDTMPGFNSSVLNINILYPPSKPAFYFGDQAEAIIPDNTLSVIQGNVTTVICESSANPLPTYTWNGYNNTLTFTPTVDENRTCSVRNSMVTTGYGTVSGYNSSVLIVNVLYAPGTPDLSFQSCLGEPLTLNSSIKVIHGEPVHVTCSASSSPSSTYSWSRYQVKQSNVMWIPNAQTSHDGTYTCKAENIMNITFDGPVRGNSSKLFHLDVLIPPVVKPLANVVVLERSNVSVACQITAGVPNTTNFTWERMSDMTPYSMEQTIVIPNIYRTHSGNYRCTASNLMEPTGCDATVGNSSNTVYIDVQYEAEVINFTLLHVNQGQHLEVDENAQVIFYCQTHSNPLSNISLLKESHYLKTASNTSDLEFTISKSECEEEGTYHCTAQNKHNTKDDIRSLMLFVRCAPRASSLFPTHQNITSATGEPAVFTLNLVAFPRPRVADFVWEKDVFANDTWHIVSNDTDIDILIYKDGLQTKLSFSSVKEDDFGYYRVHVHNELGNYTETFRLQAQEHPLSPYNLQHFKKATFDTIYIEWTPGLDGGLPQTFYVEYREVGASVWMKERVIAGHINYTIVGLNPETMYEIRVYSTNDIGRSNASEAITVTTLKRPETGGPPMVIITVLLVVVVVVVVVVVAVTIILVRKRKGGMPEYVSRLTTGLELQSMPNQEGTEDDNDGGKTNPTYEGCGDIQDKPYKTGSRVSQPQNKETGEVGEENDAVNKNKTDPYEHTETPQGENGQTTSYSFDTY